MSRSNVQECSGTVITQGLTWRSIWRPGTEVPSKLSASIKVALSLRKPSSKRARRARDGCIKQTRMHFEPRSSCPATYLRWRAQQLRNALSISCSVCRVRTSLAKLQANMAVSTDILTSVSTRAAAPAAEARSYESRGVSVWLCVRHKISKIIFSSIFKHGPRVSHPMP